MRNLGRKSGHAEVSGFIISVFNRPECRRVALSPALVILSSDHTLPRISLPILLFVDPLSLVPPETGASTKSAPLADARLATLLAVAGSMVLASTSTAPFAMVLGERMSRG